MFLKNQIFKFNQRKTDTAIPNHTLHPSSLSSVTFGLDPKTVIASTNPSPGKVTPSLPKSFPSSTTELKEDHAHTILIALVRD